MATVIERVRAGATFLDSQVVGWAEKIDADRLDLRRCEDCVFGQAFDDNYINVAHWLGLTNHQCAALGFCSEAANRVSFAEYMALGPEAKAVHRSQIATEYRNLRAAWLHEIALRLGTPEAEEARVEASPADVGEVWGAL